MLLLQETIGFWNVDRRIGPEMKLSDLDIITQMRKCMNLDAFTSHYVHRLSVGIFTLVGIHMADPFKASLKYQLLPPNLVGISGKPWKVFMWSQTLRTYSSS